MPWILLTNGRYWQMYHLTFDEGIQSDLVWSTDILEDDLKTATSKISLLHRKNIVKGVLEKYLSKVQTLSPKSILQAIFQENTLRIIRSHLKKSSGVSVNEEDLVISIRKMISQETWETIGDIKVKKKKKVTRAKKNEKSSKLSVVAPVDAGASVLQMSSLEDEDMG
jgi:DNA replication initiation complex subunit (GINS family)